MLNISGVQPSSSDRLGYHRSFGFASVALFYRSELVSDRLFRKNIVDIAKNKIQYGN